MQIASDLRAIEPITFIDVYLVSLVNKMLPDNLL